MGRLGIERSPIVYDMTISACEKGGQWPKALELFEEMGRLGFERSAFTYSAMISVCEKFRLHDLCIMLYGLACSEGVYNHFKSSPHGEIDLRGCCGGVAKAAFLFRLSEIRSGRESLEEDLVIVTGDTNTSLDLHLPNTFCVRWLELAPILAKSQHCVYCRKL